MISLNSINLGSLNLGGMNTSEIKLGYPSSGCPVPGLKGLQGFYMGKGLTNEMMSRDPVWRDKSGKGNHIQLKNFGWKLQSGVGMYAHDFSNKWGLFHSSNSLLQSTSIVLKSGTGNWGVKIDKGTGNIVNFKAKLIVEGLDKLDDIKLYFGKFDLNPGVVAMEELHEGLNAIDVDIPSSYGWYGFGFKQTIENANVKITLLPYAYDGALCFDGVDDYGICETFPILTKEKGYTVMALRKWISREKQFESLVSNVDVWGMGKGAFVVEYRNLSDMAISFDRVTSIRLSAMLSYQTSTDYNGQTLMVGETSATNVVLVGKTAKTKFERYSNFALYALAIFDHDTTEEERQPVIDYWKKEFPELFPDQAWTVTGKTNSDADRATIKNITGNGNDLVLTNFGFKENSGYGKYSEDYSSAEWRLALDRAETVKNNFSFHTTSITSTVVAMYYQSYLGEDPFTVKSYNIKVSGLKDGQSVRYLTGGVVISTIDSDGIFKLPSFDFAANKAWYGFAFDKIQESCDITIEQIPDNEGYLVTDGVDDEIISSQKFALSKDYTVVGDWKLLVDETKACGIVRVYQLYIYTNVYGIQLHINSTSINTVLKNIKSLKAVCSNGKVYDEDWNEIIIKTGDLITDSNKLYLGYLGSNYTQLAFKNLAIYNNTILTKDQCIRAYNYLQTIKNV